MNAMCETLETRSLMSATMGPTELAADAGGTETTALLLPAVQKVREAAASSSSSNASGHTGGVNVCMGDGSVKFGDGSVRSLSDSVNVTTW